MGVMCKIMGWWADVQPRHDELLTQGLTASFSGWSNLEAKERKMILAFRPSPPPFFVLVVLSVYLSVYLHDISASRLL